MTTFLIVLALLAAGLFIELIAANRAPFGCQDESGFHFQSPHDGDSRAFEFENPS